MRIAVSGAYKSYRERVLHHNCSNRLEAATNVRDCIVSIDTIGQPHSCLI